MKGHRFSPITSPLEKFRSFDSYKFYTTGINDFGPLYVKLKFDSKTDSEATLHKIYVCHIVHMCIRSRCDFRHCSTVRYQFIYSKHQQTGCPTYIISDGGRNFVSIETQDFFSRLGNELELGKELRNLKLNYEELQTVLLEIETTLNNRPLRYYYADKNEPCLTPNHIL